MDAQLLSESEDAPLRRPDPLPAQVEERPVAGGAGPCASANPVARLQYERLDARREQRPRRHQPGEARADDHDIGPEVSICVTRVAVIGAGTPGEYIHNMTARLAARLSPRIRYRQRRKARRVAF